MAIITQRWNRNMFPPSLSPRLKHLLYEGYDLSAPEPIGPKVDPKNPYGSPPCFQAPAPDPTAQNVLKAELVCDKHTPPARFYNTSVCPMCLALAQQERLLRGK